jgi:hypothetical protein
MIEKTFLKQIIDRVTYVGPGISRKKTFLGERQVPQNA